VRLVIVSDHPAPVLHVLRSRIPGCTPLAVGAATDVLAELHPGTSILLDLDDVISGVAAARRLRDAGVTNGIVVVGTTAIGGMDAVVGLDPPIHIAELKVALDRVQSASDRAELPAGAHLDDDDEGQGTADDGPPPTIIDLTQHEVPETADHDGPVPSATGPADHAPRLAPVDLADAGTALLTRFRTAMRRTREVRPPAADVEPTRPTEPSILEDGILPGLHAARQLERSLRAFPILQDAGACAEAVVTEVTGRLGAEVDGVAVALRADEDGFLTVASEGLSPLQGQLRIPVDHGFVARLHDGGGAFLVTPTAEAPALVAGLPVAASTTVLGTSVWGEDVEALLLVGLRGTGTPEDLDALVRITDDSASLLALAAAVRRLHRDASADVARRTWRR
jgi:hypothetical protein